MLKLGAARKKILLVATVVATFFIGLTLATFFVFPHSVLVLAIVTLVAFSVMLILDLYRSLTSTELPGYHEGKYHTFDCPIHPTNRRCERLLWICPCCFGTDFWSCGIRNHTYFTCKNAMEREGV